MTLITGALPAQYGFQTAGVVDIQTKTGTTNPGLAISMYGGQQSWAQPSFEYGGRSGPVDWFITADYLHNDIGIENPTTSFNPIHDTTNQFHGLAYVSAIIDPDTRISMILGGFEGQFQIPNNPGQPTLGFSVNGVGNFNSANLNENQHERTDFAIFSLQKHVADIDLQISAYTRYSSLSFSPDSWVICCSMASRSRRRARTPHMACKLMEAGASTTNIRFASAFWCSRRSATGRHSRRCCRWTARARRRPMCQRA